MCVCVCVCACAGIDVRVCRSTSRRCFELGCGPKKSSYLVHFDTPSLVIVQLLRLLSFEVEALSLAHRNLILSLYFIARFVSPSRWSGYCYCKHMCVCVCLYVSQSVFVRDRYSIWQELRHWKPIGNELTLNLFLLAWAHLKAKVIFVLSNRLRNQI